jgi:5-methylcytosine-specific restriction endonuclease McrA
MGKSKEDIAARQKAYYQTHREEILAKKRAYDQAQYRLDPEYYRRRIRDYYAVNPEKMLEKGRRRRAKHPGEGAIHAAQRRARKRSNAGIFTRAEWQALQDHYRHRCYYCAKKVTKLTMDHIMPLSQGGKHSFMNIVPACRSCNSRKGIRPPKNVQPVLLLPVKRTKPRRTRQTPVEKSGPDESKNDSARYLVSLRETDQGTQETPHA